MAGKRGAGASKTAHVLNLLSGGEAPEAPERAPGGGDRADGGAADRAHGSPAAPGASHPAADCGGGPHQ
ncbi:MAG: hypothetical protein ACLRNQ_01635 [Flavonifractor plautii]